MAVYSARQSTYVDGDVITAADSNDEFDTILAAFHATTGHPHDGTAGGGPLLVATGALNTGSITSGFGNIDNGASNVTSGGLVKLDVDADADDLTGDSATGRLTLGAGEDLNLYHGGTNSYIVNDTGDLILDTADDIVLDAAGGDIFFKAAGTTFGSATNTSGDLIIKSGTTTAMTFSGANVTFSGTVTIGSAEISEAELEILDDATITTTELNLIDGDTARGTTSLASGDGILINDAGTMRMTNVDTVSTYMASSSVGGGSIVTVGALDSGSITSGFGAIDNGSSAITTTGTITGGNIIVDDINLNGKVMVMTGDTDDTVTFTAAASGALSIVTVDDAAAAGHIQITADGTVDIDSAGIITLDSGAAINIEPASGSAILLDGTISIDAGVITGATSITSTTFVGALTGNASGTAATVTGAAQTNITSVGTLTALTVDDINLNGKVIVMTGDTDDTVTMTAAASGAFSLVTVDDAAAAGHIQITADGTVDIDSAGIITLDSGAAINIEPASGSAILLDGTISIDAGVVTGATSITSTEVVVSGALIKSVTDSITAGTTQNQAGATALTKDINRVTASGTDGDGVALPTAVAGAEITIINSDSAQTIQVWPATDDAIDGGSANAVDAKSLAAGDVRSYFAIDATNWHTKSGAAAASATLSGIVELATIAETTTGTDAGRAVTPDGLHDMTSLSGAAWMLDEDDMSTDSNTKVASQQSIKAYVDGAGATPKNLVINGDFRISQRAVSFATLTASQYTLDRHEWIDTGTTAGAVTITQATDVPTVAQAGVQFSNSIKFDCTTAEDLGSADAALYFSHKIIAKECVQFGHGASGAKSGVISFWIKSTKTGIITVNLDRNDASEKYSFEVTINSADTWELKTQVVPGDTGGTVIANDNGIGLTIQIMFAVGGDGDTSTADAWNASGATELATSNQVNLLDNTSNDVFLAGLDFYVGTAARTFVVPNFQDELARAQFYFFRHDFDAAAHEYISACNVTSATLARAVYYYPEIMKGIPTLTSSAAATFNVEDDDATNINVSAIGLSSQVTKHNVSAQLSFAGSATVGGGNWKRDASDTAYLTGEHEL